ncbi:MAG: GNAT family N-acetyltransferase [Sneathiella sp.]|nr:GNAT family N-acetyltransferase [Sneathiella sp.]
MRGLLIYEPGYCIYRKKSWPNWGQGYATEAAKACINYAFEQLDLSELVSFTAVLNIRSQAVMKKLGFQYTEDGFDHPEIEDGHRLRRHVLYRLMRDKWLEER